MPRPKGSKNRATIDVKQALSVLISNNIGRFEEELDALHGKAYTDTYLKACEYVLPKAKEEEVVVNVPKLEIKLNGINEKAK